jgi:antitoxin HicB
MKVNEMPHTVEEYLSLPYTIEVFRDETGGQTGWVARVAELSGCITQADSFAELEEMVQDAMRTWTEAALEEGISIPEPRPIPEFSGKFVVRVPKSLHRQLVETAGQEGVSLNQYINVALAAAVSRPVNSGSAGRPGSQPELLGIEQFVTQIRYTLSDRSETPEAKLRVLSEALEKYAVSRDD